MMFSEVEILINSFSVPNTLIGEKSILNLKNKSSKTVICTSDTVLEWYIFKYNIYVFNN